MDNSNPQTSKNKKWLQGILGAIVVGLILTIIGGVLNFWQEQARIILEQRLALANNISTAFEKYIVDRSKLVNHRNRLFDRYGSSSDSPSEFELEKFDTHFDSLNNSHTVLYVHLNSVDVLFEKKDALSKIKEFEQWEDSLGSADTRRLLNIRRLVQYRTEILKLLYREIV